MGIEQLIILLVIGAISFVNWLIRQSVEARERKKQQANEDRGGDTPSILSEQEAEGHSPAPPTARREENPDESMRKLMEALGLPLEEEPPKPVQPARRPLPVAPPELPPPVFRTPEPPPKLREVVEDPYAQRPFVADPERRRIAPLPRIERDAEFAVSLESVTLPSASLHDWNQSPVSKPEAAREAERRNIRKLLSARSSVRDAIILAEVLGKPKALQD